MNPRTPSDEPPQGSQQENEMSKELYPGSRLTTGESLLLIMGHALRHHASKEATESLLKLIEAHLPENTALPTSRYLFFKEFASSRAVETRHFYCPDCLSYLGKDTGSEMVCEKCSRACDINALAAADSYFVTLDLKQQFSELLRDPSIHIDETSRDMSLDVGNITTSSSYHEMPVKDDDFTVTWNTGTSRRRSVSGHFCFRSMNFQHQISTSIHSLQDSGLVIGNLT